jgi:molecular chaperone GrpE
MQDEIHGANQETKPEAEDEGQALQQQLHDWRAKADDYLDKYRRSVAEFDNYRKRVERDRDAERLRIKRNLFLQILPVTDDFERALNALDDEKADAVWAEGVLLIARKMGKVLADAGVTPIEAVGQPFDPHYHEALMRAESQEHPEGVVMQELQKGYMLEDTVLRPASVVVSGGPGPV